MFNSNEEIFVEMNDFLDSAKFIAQNFTDDNYIENNVSKGDSNEKIETKPNDEVISDNNELPDTSEVPQTIEPISASIPVEMTVAGNNLIVGFALFAVAIGGGGSGGGGFSTGIGSLVHQVQAVEVLQMDTLKVHLYFSM